MYNPLINRIIYALAGSFFSQTLKNDSRHTCQYVALHATENKQKNLKK